MNPNEALGLPPGSVRAILALFVIPLTELGALALMFLMFWKNQYETALGILSGITGTSGIVIGHYFGSKAANKATDEMIKSHKEALENQKSMIEKEVETRRELLARKDIEIDNITRNIRRNISMEEIV